MASTRSQTSAPRTAPPLQAGTTKQALVALVRHAAHIQIAACTSAVATLTTWSAKADRFAQSVGDELTVTLRAAADHLDARLARASVDTREVR